MNKPEEGASHIRRSKFYIKHGLQMLQYLTEFYRALDEITANVDKLEKAPGKVMIFFTSKELTQALHSNNAQEIESLLMKHGCKRHNSEGETRYELLDILVCFNNIFQSLLKI